MALTVFSSVIAGLVLAGLIAAFKTHWLYVIVPKPYLNTPLSVGGQVVSVSMVNMGFLLEEDVEVRFGSVGHFEVIASSDSTVTFEKNRIRLPKLPRFQTVTVHILVEGKAFDLSDIEAVDAKTARGKVVDKKEKATSLWSYLVAIPILCIFLLPFSLGTVMGRDSNKSAFDYLLLQLDGLRPSKQLAGYQLVQNEQYPGLSGPLSKAIQSGKIDLHIDEIVRRDDVLTITVTMSNHLQNTIVATVDATTSASDAGPLDFWDSRIKDTFIAADTSRTKQLKAYLPESSKPKVVVLAYRLQMGGNSSSVEQTITFPY